MSGSLRFHDGTVFDTTNFEFLDKYRAVTPREKHGIVLAWHICSETKDFSIVLVKWDGVFAQALGYKTFRQMLIAITTAREAQFRNTERFLKRVVAVLNFAPDYMQANSLSALGVDVIFAPNH